MKQPISEILSEMSVLHARLASLINQLALRYEELVMLNNENNVYGNEEER